ncbi:hypothetical protein DIPPA_25280 [Diplonema papillatum]|nr:hypothetical protein DIPPA_25280 [Diplonema papillatum]
MSFVRQSVRAAVARSVVSKRGVHAWSHADFVSEEQQATENMKIVLYANAFKQCQTPEEISASLQRGIASAWKVRSQNVTQELSDLHSVVAPLADDLELGENPVSLQVMTDRQDGRILEVSQHGVVAMKPAHAGSIPAIDSTF